MPIYGKTKQVFLLQDIYITSYLQWLQCCHLSRQTMSLFQSTLRKNIQHVYKILTRLRRSSVHPGRKASIHTKLSGRQNIFDLSNNVQGIFHACFSE